MYVRNSLLKIARRHNAIDEKRLHISPHFGAKRVLHGARATSAQSDGVRGMMLLHCPGEKLRREETKMLLNWQQLRLSMDVVG